MLASGYTCYCIFVVVFRTPSTCRILFTAGMTDRDAKCAVQIRAPINPTDHSCTERLPADDAALDDMIY